MHFLPTINPMKSQANEIDQPLKSAQISDQCIVAIGASAGGMEAIHIFFDHTLPDAVSYVIIQHLSPDHKSFMSDLLYKHSKLKIHEVQDGMEVLPNCIYVMPSAKIMTIADGKLVLKDRQGSTPNSAIDTFFNSLAEDQGNKSIGIVLSGNGSDGTKGISAIKKVGGMVIVQDPASTEYNSMPNQAIESGNYDYILTPELIPQQIINYVSQRSLANIFSDPISDTDEASLMEVINIIKDHTPLNFTEYKRPTIARRIIRRMIANNTESIVTYIELLKTNPSEIEVLSKDFMISVTKFFRDPEAFEILRTKVIPEIVGNKLLIDTLKIWVIGCATGEEAYSMAILIKEHLINLKKDIEVKIFASDIDKEALVKAAKGVYHESKIIDIDEKYLNMFFVKEGNEYRVKEAIRSMIIFADHDVTLHPPYGKIDIISCRNLLIYLNPELQKKIFSTLHSCLNIGGCLFLGPSEGIGNMKNVFQEVDKKWKIYKNMEGGENTGLGQFSAKHIEIKKYNFTSIAKKSSKNNLPSNLSEIIIQSHLEESGFTAGVCIDEFNKIILPFGKFENFLISKLFNNNLLELLPSELAVACSTSIRQAMNSNVKIIVKGIKITEHDVTRSLRILVKPFLFENASFQKVFIIYFCDEEKDMIVDRIFETFDTNLNANRHLFEIQKELQETKMQLLEADNALEESNDSIQSYNEELLSGNEEMQSANEELQSINEELNTLNIEYQTKIKELAELNDDFNNYFKSSYNSQIYVDKNLLIRKFTPISIKQINLKETDIGRPLADISTNIKFCNLIEDIQWVVDNQTLKESQIQTTDGKWYLMMVLPYVRSKDGQIDGAIITFNDITDIKKSKAIIESANQKLIKINQDHDTFIYSVSHDLKAPLNNIEGLISILKESTDIGEMKSITNLLEQSLSNHKQTIKELADITKFEKEYEDPVNVNLIELLEEVKISIRDLLLESNAKINIEVEEKIINFSKKNARSIVFNLLSNAVKYRSHDRELEIMIKSQRFDGYIVFSVSDNGLGIDHDKIGKVFSKFKRVHDLDVDVEGSGIGLYLVKKIISNTGGKIEVESQLGKGSCFKVYFIAK